MAVVELQLPALPAHVRTARMVCVTAARRAGLRDEFVDELRLAVGEACARAVGLHAQHAPAELVTVRVVDDMLGLTVTVHDCGPEAGPAVDDVAGQLGGTDHADGEDTPDPDVALAVLDGLVDEVEVTATEGEGTTVTLRWPLPRRLTGGTPGTVLSAG
ncbi:MAG TPA: ATP-binding protein [Mycobacteriales bacterium]|jgi:anti-sigma regulatory factor (Ser/Thr protein kinase)|nr:ATP-binding protein [Mycobacteriales bacterium]